MAGPPPGWTAAAPAPASTGGPPPGWAPQAAAPATVSPAASGPPPGWAPAPRGATAAPSPTTGLQASADRVSAKYGIRPALFRSLVDAESSWDPHARSKVGAQGLTQLMPDTARSLGVHDPFDPEQNLDGGARYLKGLLDRFHGDERLAVAAYNAGPGAVEEHRGVPPYKETQNYVQRVLGAAGASFQAIGGGIDHAAKTTENAIRHAFEEPLRAVDAVLGAPQRFFSGAITSGSTGNPIHDLIHGAQVGADVATHPRNDAMQHANIERTMHALGADRLDNAIRGVMEGAEARSPGWIKPLEGGAKNTAHFLTVLGAQAVTDPTMLIGLGEVGREAHAAEMLDEATRGARAVEGATGVAKVLGAPARMAQAAGRSQLVQLGRQVFGRRPELDQIFTPTGKAARLGIEAKVEHGTIQPLATEHAAILKKNEQAMRGVPAGTGADLPPDVARAYMAETYVFGTPAMKAWAAEHGFEPTAHEAQIAADPHMEGLLDYNPREDYQTLISPPTSKFTETPGFQAFQRQYHDGEAAFEKARTGDRADLGRDQYDVVSNRLRLQRLWVQQRLTDRLTAEHVQNFGGMTDGSRYFSPGTTGVTYGPVRYELPGELGTAARTLRKLGTESVKLNPLPHSLRNVGMLQGLFAGPRGFGTGIAYAARDLSAAQKQRLAESGLGINFHQDVEGPLTMQVLEKYGGMPGKGAAATAYGLSRAGEMVMNRLENGYRAAAMEHLDRTMGPSRSIADEYVKADQVRRALGDYKNVSRFVAGLQAIGGPFVAFRVGIVPSAVGRAVIHAPQRVEAIARSEEDVNKDPRLMGGSGARLDIGGPVEDAARMAFTGGTFTPQNYFLSPSTIGLPGTVLGQASRAVEGQGTSAAQGGELLAREFIPGAGYAESAMGAPYGLPPGVTPFEALMVQAFGPYLARRRSARADQRKTKQIFRAQ